MSNPVATKVATTFASDAEIIKNSSKLSKVIGIEMPLGAEAILEALFEAREAAHSVLTVVIGKLHVLAEERDTLIPKIGQLEDDNYNQFQHGSNTKKIAAIRQDIARLDAEIAELQKKVQLKDDQFQKIAALADRALNWLKKLDRDDFLQPCNVDVPKSIEVPKLRQQIAELSADMHQVKSAPFSASLAKTVSREKIERMAAAGAPDVLHCVDTGQPFKFSFLAAADDFSLHGADLSACQMAWLHKDEMIAKIEAEIDELADDANALDPAEREAKLTTLAEERLKLERIECELIQNNPNQFEYRADVSIEALLGVEVLYDDGRSPAEKALDESNARELTPSS
jgi:outer membrane murein-binding lipoprotein Lpp